MTGARRKLLPAAERVDPDQIRASRDFHVRHWLELAKSSIAQDHRKILYEGLAPAVEAALRGCPDATDPALLRDLAFMEGHVQAYRIVMEALVNLTERSVSIPPVDSGS